MEDRYTDGVKNAWKFAAQEAAKLGSDYIGTEHLLIGIAHEGDSAGGKILNSLGITVGTLEELLSGSRNTSLSRRSELYVAPRTKRVLEMAVEEANELGNSYVGTEHLLLAILHEGGLAVRILEQLGVTEDKLQKAFEDVLSEDNSKSDQSASLGDLSDFAIDLNERAKQGKIDPVIGREEEINRVIQILSRRSKNNPVLIGEPGVGKTAIAEGLAQRIVNNDVPEILKNCHIISLNMSAVVAGTKYRGEFEERLKKVLDTVKQHPDWILFIDELHTLVGAGSSEGSMDAANIMKPALARGELHCIGATTLKEYKKYIEKDAALERRFQPVKVGEPNPADTLRILEGLRDRYEAFHKAKITDEALKAAVELSGRYITDRFQPDKSIDVIDEAAAKVRMEASSAPEGLKNKEAQLASLQKEKEAAISTQDYERAAIYRDQSKKLEADIEQLKKEWKGADHDHLTVTEEDVAEVVSKWTGVPLQNLKKSDSERLLHLEDELHKRVIGQDDAVHAVATAIRRARAGMKDPKRPIGSFLFLGSTGVGKTELARALAETMFGSEKNMIRFDMSEYMEKHEVSRLVGAPPGYVGYEEGGQLTDAVRKNPYSVILFDEVEKAHPDVFNLLLQVLDEGRLTDSLGRRIDFKNTILIMTSNIGTRQLKDFGRGVGFNTQMAGEPDKDFSRSVIQKALNKAFAPEFLNRVDDIIMFDQLDKAAIHKIIDIELQGLYQRVSNLGYELSITDEAKDFIATKGYDIQFGARPLKRAIQKYLEDEMAEMIIRASVGEGDTIIVDFDKEEQKITTSIKKKDAE